MRLVIDDTRRAVIFASVAQKVKAEFGEDVLEGAHTQALIRVAVRAAVDEMEKVLC